jgi:hypothetical protein
MIAQSKPVFEIIKKTFGNNMERMAGYIATVVNSFAKESRSINMDGVGDEERIFAEKLIRESSPNGPDGQEDLLGQALFNLKNQENSQQGQVPIDNTNSLATLLKYLARKSDAQSQN